MDDVNLRLEFHRALDPVAPPAPWLAPRVREALRRERRASWVQRMRRRSADVGWLLPLVAFLIAGAIIASLLLGAHALRFSIPVIPPPHQAPAAASTCPTWGYIPGGGNAPVSIKMMSTAVGWAAGDLRTNDGGAHWHDVSPAALRSGAPYLPGQQTVYPPNYADFFLDSNHAWLVRSYESATSCVDHLTVFMTADGGRTWRQSANVAVAIRGNLNVALYFIDSRHGWLFAPTGPGGGLLYATADGGADWRALAGPTVLCPAFMFSSSTTGWSTCTGEGSNSGSPAAELIVTHDGGLTWRALDLPSPPHGCGCSVDLPVFFDPMHGAVQVFGNSGQDVFVTSDGGVTWTVLASVPGLGPSWSSIDFEDANDFWLVGGAAKGGPATNSLYRSTDGGRTWNLVERATPIGSPIGPVGVQFLDPTHGFVLELNPQTGTGPPELLVTSDGGHTWTVIQVQIS